MFIYQFVTLSSASVRLSQHSPVYSLETGCSPWAISTEFIFLFPPAPPQKRWRIAKHVLPNTPFPPATAPGRAGLLLTWSNCSELAEGIPGLGNSLLSAAAVDSPSSALLQQKWQQFGLDRSRCSAISHHRS